jgi:alpha-tubulin suppressor-like RCC1 family protein
MSTNFKTDDVTRGAQLTDLDDRYVTESWLIDRFTQGTLFAWGNNDNGQLGLGDRIHRSSPVQVGALTDWRLISGNIFHALAIKQDYSLWSWGSNVSRGVLGDGTTISRSSPVQIGSGLSWKSASAGFTHSLALTEEDAQYAWGDNANGQLGLGDTVHRSSPVQIGSDNIWKFVYAAQSTSFGIRTGGTLWSWGNNGGGLLGLGDFSHRSSPVQVGLQSNWKQISASDFMAVGINSKGELFVWGSNINGSLGLGLSDGPIISTPVQLGTETEWQKVATSQTGTGGFEACIAIKTNGTLWVWGDNTAGQLGLGDTIHRSSPTQLGSLQSWKTALLGRAVKKDGTLWTWGRNTDGNLGLGDLTHRSTPVQVGTKTNWKSVEYNFALTYKEEI